VSGSATTTTMQATFIATTARTDIVSTQKRKAHGCLMVVAWILLASTGILLARYAFIEIWNEYFMQD
jgi:hypothetical protein